MADRLRVEVAYAEPDRQWLLPVDLAPGATVADAIEASGIAAAVPGLDIVPDRLGVFGKKASMDRPLRDGDRVEIYRPLLIDPKEERRARAKAQKDEP